MKTELKTETEQLAYKIAEAIVNGYEISGNRAIECFYGTILRELPQILNGTCDTCTHYTPGSHYHRVCTCPKMIYGYGNFNKENDTLKVEDDEGWGMIPGPKFGCIHHSPKG